MSRRRRRALHELPTRTCRYGGRCCVCLGKISMGRRYRDGGWPRRAHTDCAVMVQAGRRHELTRGELRRVDAAETAVATAKGKIYQARSAAAVSWAKGKLLRAEQAASDLRAELTGGKP